MSTDREEHDLVEQIIQRVSAKSHGADPAVRTAVRQCHAQFDRARIGDFIPVLVERAATSMLRHNNLA